MCSLFWKQAQSHVCGTINYIMRYLLILCITLVVTSVQMHPQTSSEIEQKTVIRNNNVNKNVNVIVNLDSQTVANELWKIIEARLSNHTSYITSSKSAIRDLENIVQPLLSSTRKDGTLPSAYQVASQFDQITRRMLATNIPAINSLDEEITIRDIVTDMMASLKMYISKTIQVKIEEMDAPTRRTMHSPVAINNDEREEYVNIKIKMNKNDLIQYLCH